MHRPMRFKPSKKKQRLLPRSPVVKPPPKVQPTQKIIAPPKRVHLAAPASAAFPPHLDRVNQFIGNAKALKEITALFSQPKPFLLYVHGPCGVGKSELIRLMCKTYRMNMVVPEKRFLRQQWTQKRLQRSLLNFDDIISLDQSDNGLIQQLRAFVTKPTPCCVYISSDSNARYKQLAFLCTKKSKVMVKPMYHPYESQLRTVFGPTIAKGCRGDVRQAKILKQHRVAQQADPRYTSFDICRQILDHKCASMNDAVERYKVSDGFGKLLLFENYLQDDLTPDDMSRCANAFSEMYFRPEFDLAVPMTLHLTGNHNFFGKFEMSMPKRTKKPVLSPSEVRTFLFKVGGPCNDGLEAQRMYLELLATKFTGMTLSARRSWKKKYQITQIEQQFMLARLR